MRRQVYIASQGNELLSKFPLNAHFVMISGPTDNSVEDFWCMIWEQHIPTIVMLTRLYEGKVSSV